MKTLWGGPLDLQRPPGPPGTARTDPCRRF